MPVDPQTLDEFSTEAAKEVARVWEQQFQQPLREDDLERLTAAIRLALNHKILFDSNAERATRPTRVRDAR